MLRIDVAASDGQAAVNEDVVGYCGTAAWVIDGATGIGETLLDGASDAAWLARTADQALRESLDADPGQPTVDLMRGVMATCRDRLERAAIRDADGDHEHPSAAFAMVRVIDGTIEFATLGDCRIAYIDSRGEARLFGVTAMEALEAKTIALAASILDTEPDISADAFKAKLLPQLRSNRRLMNTPEGYWVLGTNPSAADHMDQAAFELEHGQRFALASDGFLRLVELFGASSPADMLSISTHDQWRGALERLRALEREPDSRRRYPRVKMHDDASFIAFTCRGAA